MLQGNSKEKTLILLLVGFSALLNLNCKVDTSTASEEEEAYLADYEVPTNRWGFMDKTGFVVIKPTYDDVGSFSEGLAAVNRNGKWGYIDLQGKIVIEPQFKSAWAFHEHRARVHPFNRPEHFIDRSGLPIASEEWTAADDFSEGIARVKAGSNFGYVDTLGQMVIQPVYTRGWNFIHGIAVIEFEEKLGVIDAKGTEVLPTSFDKIKINQDAKIILCMIKGSSILYDLSGNEIQKLEGTSVVETDGNLISVRKNDKMYFFDLQQKMINTDGGFVTLLLLGDKRWAGKKENGYYLLDQNGKILSNTVYTQINRFSDGFAVYSKDEYWGYLDLGGTDVTGSEFGMAWDYKEGMARAAFKDGIAFIDRNQQLAFYPPSGTMDFRDFSEGLAPIQIAR